MKHTTKIIVAFISMFMLAQVLGIYLLSSSIQEILVVYSNTSIGERPQVEGYNSIIYIAVGIIIGTVLLLLIAKYNKMTFWKIWFSLAAWMTMSISIGALIGEKIFWLSWLLAAILAIIKLKYPHPLTHNLTELLMYAGIALLLAPILTVPVAIILLLLISAYDAYAVWKSKHMIAMAQFTKKSNLFPGLSLSYIQNKNKTTILSKVNTLQKEEKIAKETKDSQTNHSSKNNAKTGILGGGDVVFPLLFAGAAFTWLISKGFSSLQAMSYSLIISIGGAIALFLLFYFGKQEKFYPAMPFITAGCLAGYGLMMLLI